MARRKQPNPILTATSVYVQQHFPELAHAAPLVRMLDGPPDSPRYAVTLEACDTADCPYAFSTQPCQVHDCPLRRTLRLLLDRRGAVVQATQSGIHWS